jgi:hypothetical protein
MPIIVNQSAAPVGFTLSTLKQSIANRLGRNSLSNMLGEFITYGEARIYNGFRDLDVSVDPLRIRPMLAAETASLSSLPDGFLSVERVTVPDGSGASPSLAYLTPQEFSNLLPGGGSPRYYTIADGVVQVEGGQPKQFTLSYYRRFMPLAGDNDTNWLLQNAPQVYLYSVLIEAYQHVRDDVHAISAARQYAAAINALLYADQVERFSGSTLTIGNSR